MKNFSPSSFVFRASFSCVILSNAKDDKRKKETLVTKNNLKTNIK